MKEKIKETLKIIPKTPGCYQFFDINNEIIYIGKAKNLKRRVSSYFQKKHTTPKLQILVPQVEHIECVMVNNEVEALILESQLIKKHKPKYNVLLKDDKKFPYFLITNEEYPRIVVTRKANQNGIKGKYFGPYTDSRAMYSTLEILQKIFPLKKCKTPKFSSRPCLYYDMGQCCAPCQKYVTPEDYKKILKEAELFLNGKQKELIKILSKKMEECSLNLEYEKAARLRDGISDILKTMERQQVVFENKNMFNDFISIEKIDNTYCASILEIREGRLLGKKDFEFTKYSDIDETDISDTIIREYYGFLGEDNIPKKIYISALPNEIEIYSKWLSQKSGHSVKILLPSTKNEKDIMELSLKNARLALERIKLKELYNIQEGYNEIGSYIKEKLELKQFPHIIECYDISHIQGTNTVASRVTFENGQPKKSLYRKYKLKTIEKGEVDDFKSMREVLSRRFKRILSNQDKAPDLIIIDGGKGQLSSVIQVMKEVNLDLDIVSLAKKEEEIFKPDKKEPVILPLNSKALFLIQRIRDEAHRFAITFHRKLRNDEMLKSDKVK